MIDERLRGAPSKSYMSRYFLVVYMAFFLLDTEYQPFEMRVSQEEETVE